MKLFKKFLIVLFSAFFLLFLSTPLFAPGGDDPSPEPPIMPGDGGG